MGFTLTGLIAAIIWLWFTTNILGVGRSGFGNAAIIIVLPLWTAGLGLFIWLPWWLIHRRKLGVMSHRRALISGGVIGGLVSLIIMGPNGFTMHGGAVLMAYALIASSISGGWLHNALLRRGG